MTDVVSPEKRSEIMRQVKSEDTSLEQKVRSGLWRLGYRFRKHVRSLPGTPDIVFAGAKTAVFIDSCFWHGCPRHCRLPKSNREYWGNKIKRNRARDQKVNQQYEESDWQAVRVWEHTTDESFEEAIKTLAGILDRRYEMDSPGRRGAESVIQLEDELGGEFLGKKRLDEG